jgi:TRAP-type C4-dicarboxylate transport system substrate-binding protein
MENARALNERLRNIIREVSSKTGGEMKKDLLDEMNQNVEEIIKEQSDIQTREFLQALKQAIKKV